MESPRILLVEDDAGMRQYLRNCLVPLDVRIDEVADGREALAWLDEHPVDLLISDVVMPGIGGIALLDALAERPGLEALPILFVTGESDEAEATGRPVLRKPFSGSLLRVYVEEMLKDVR